MKTIACVLNTGGMRVFNRQVNYGPQHVLWLKAQCERFAGPHRFVCLSDCKIPGVNTVPLVNRWQGWWSKIELFREFSECLYMDLDVVLTGDISHILAHPHVFTALSGFAGFPERMNSSLMAWHGDFSYIYSTFAARPQWHMQQNKTHRFWGDQGFIMRNLPPDWDRFQTMWPGQVVSFKLNLNKGDPQPDNRLVVMHGHPKPWDMVRPWIPPLCAA